MKSQLMIGACLVVFVAGVFSLVRGIAFHPHYGMIAYIQSGDVWVRSLPHGQPLQLTDDGINSHPLLSTSGKWIAFRKGKNHLWLMRTDGKDHHHLQHEHGVEKFKWAVASERLAYTVNGDLWIVKAGENEPRRLISGPQRKYDGVREFLWSPDEQFIAYEYQERRDVAKDEWPWRNSIRQVQTNTGAFDERITFPSPDEEGMPGNIHLAAWHGERIFFWQCEIMSVSIISDGCPLFYLDTTNRQQEIGLTSLLGPDFLAFAPDGNTLAMVEGGGRETWADKNLHRINLDSSDQKVLTTAVKTVALSPSWSPEGSHLVYVAGLDLGVSDTSVDEIIVGIQKRRLWAMGADGRDAHQLTKNEDYQEERPLFLNDKKHLVFARINATEEVSLWIMQNDGQAVEQVATNISLPDKGRMGYYGQIGWNEVFDCTCSKQER